MDIHTHNYGYSTITVTSSKRIIMKSVKFRILSLLKYDHFIILKWGRVRQTKKKQYYKQSFDFIF